MTRTGGIHRLAIRGLLVTVLVLAAACAGDDTTDTDGATGTGTTNVVATSRPSDTTSDVGIAPSSAAPSSTATTHAASTSSSPATNAPVAPADVVVYLLHGERLVVTHRQVAGPAVLRGALEALLAGPTAVDADMTSAIPAGTTLRSVDLDPDPTGSGGVATVDLTRQFAAGGGSLSMFARVAQVVFTATQFPNVDRVVFRMDGAPIDALGGEGLVLTDPQTRAMVDRGLSGSVIVDSPHPGDTVTSPIRVIGEGDVYEAQFPIEIWQNGVMIGGLAPVTAGAMGTWRRFDVEIPVTAAPGQIELVAYDAGGCGTGPECPEPIRTVVELQFAG